MNEPRTDLLKITSLAWSFVPFSAVKFAVSENIFSILNKQVLSASELAQLKSWKLRPTQALVALLCELQLLEIVNDRLSLTDQSKRFLTQDSDLYMGDFFIRNELLQKAYTELNDLFVTDTPNKMMHDHVKGSFGLTADNAHEKIKEFGKPMMAASKIIYEDLFSHYSIDQTLSVLDIGGGIGTLEQILLQKDHTGTIAILETEEVANVAEHVLDTPSVLFIKENWSSWVPSQQYDRVFLSHVLHEEKLDEAKKLFQKAVQSTKPSGQMIVIGFMGEAGDSAVIGSIFRMNLLLEMGSDLPSLKWLKECAEVFNLREEMTLSLSGGRIAWIVSKI